ncbi:hypothetical protein FQ377_02745 [Arthrobacter echini]|uniref:Uncharacterized protein n=1 Tax=Arthrobacter echini TaxID=1529066 RepID=A0A5D0XU45_9MICC|nr:hypothetical protein [Arthrobacter echini]TYD00385.1 hypothetical protein FQ377_02745 [Arthrobacter echini]
MSTRLTPSEDFPQDLSALELPEVEVLNSKIHRELDYEYVHDGEPSMETEIRQEELAEELNRREHQPQSTSVLSDVVRPLLRSS